MNHDEVVSLIGSVVDPKRAFIKRTGGGILPLDGGAPAGISWVYALDANLCIYVDLKDDSFLAPRFDDPVIGGVGRYYRVFYGPDLIESVRFAPVDGGPDATGCTHALVPIPADGENAVSSFQYGVARIVNESLPNLEWAMDAASLGIPG